MYRFEFWEVVLIAGFVLWVGFQWGKFYGRDKQRGADELYRRAQQEQDPERKQKLLLEWNELSEDKHLKKAYKDALLSGKKSKE